jgi:hypothetical protein
VVIRRLPTDVLCTQPRLKPAHRSNLGLQTLVVSTLEHFTHGEWADCGELAFGASVLADGIGGAAVGGLDGLLYSGVSAIGAGKWLAGRNETAPCGATLEYGCSVELLWLDSISIERLGKIQH